MAHPLLVRARSAGAPLIDDATATFLWQGVWPPVLAGDFSKWDTRYPPAWRQLEAQLWSCTMTLPKDAYIEYAFFMGLMLPGIFGHVLCQSGAFGSPERESVLFSLVRHQPPPPPDIWMGCGSYERLAEINRKLHGALVERGCRATYREYNGGHNYPAWRNDIPLGLETLYAPPPRGSNEVTSQDC